jgi:phosphoserine phosphatase
LGLGRILVNLPGVLFSKQASAKEKVFVLFFKGMEEENFQEFCEEFCEKKIPEIIRKEMLEMFLRDLETQELVIIASASLEAYLSGFAKKYSEKVLVIGTKIEKKEGIITGKFVGKNCSKLEKIKRIIAEVDLSAAYIKIYTDGYKDEPLMALGNEVHKLK